MISEDSVSCDRADKFYEYQEAGVREYWIIDPRPGYERVDFWVLDEWGRYEPVLIGDDGIYRSTVLPGFWFRVDLLWGDEMPDAQMVFAEIAGFPPEVVQTLQEIAARGPRLSVAERGGG